MIKNIIEAPFRLVGWLFKNTYGRVVFVLLLTVFACMVNYPIQDTEVGRWEVKDTLTENFSRDGGPPSVDSVGRVDRTAIESREIIRRVELRNPWAYITLPFHHVAERQIGPDVSPPELSGKNKVIHREVLWVSRGLNLGLDLRGGTELVYRIVSPEGDAESSLANAQEAVSVIRMRIDGSGLKEPRVQPIGQNRILVQIPGFDASDVARVQSIITRIGRLEFRAVAHPAHSAAILEEAQKTGTDPEGWHNYILEDVDETTGKITTRNLLISDQIELTGEDVESANVGPGGETGSQIAVHVRFKDAETFGDVTRKYQPTKETSGWQLAILLDDVRDKEGNLVRLGRVQSAPEIRQVIMGGNAEITGKFSRKEAEELKLVLQSGSLKVPLEMESEQYVGPSQGLKAIQDGQKAIVIGFVAVVVFMVMYYLKAGLVADFALFLNLLMLVAMLALRGATLTLPGIAGIILTVGMSIDANVLIFERIREELKKMTDKPLLKCMRDGHSKALVTILDANLTTLITALILHEFGTGPVRGFAVTLSYGIIVSMFTAIVVTRVILEAAVKCGLVKTLPMLQFVSSPRIPFVAMRKLFIAVSGLLVVAGLAYFFAGPGKRMGIDFSSGTLVTVNLNEDVNADVVRGRLKAVGYKDAEVQPLASERGAAGKVGSSSFAIRLRYLPVVEVKSSGRVDGAANPDLAGWAEVIVQVNRKTDPAEIARSLAEVGSAGCAVTEGPQSDGLFTYIVRNPDKSDEAVNDLEANVEVVLGGQLVTGDIRRAFSNTDGTTLLAAQGVRIEKDTPEGVAVLISLKDATAPADLTKTMVENLGPGVKVEPEGELNDGKTRTYHISAGPGAMPKIKEALKTGGFATLEPFSGITKIYPAVARELTYKAIVAVCLALLAITAYVWFRFEFRFGLGAVIAVVHDVAITMGALALTGREISLTVIAALLTIVGYSLNDTIVVFDRIRENRRIVRKTSFPDIINISINQTLSRTILTSLTTLIAVAALFVFGGAAIEDFAFTLMIGVVVGTYSSIFIASPVLLMTGEQGALRGPLSSPGGRTVRPLEGFRPS